MNQNLNEYFSKIKAGETSQGNYFETRQDGTTRLIGSATCWRDMVGDLFGKRLSSTSGKVDYDFDDNSIIFQSGGSMAVESDRVGANLEINHEYKVGTGIVFKPHIHWFQVVSSGVAQACTLTMRYRLQQNNHEKTSSWTTVTCETGLGGDDIFDFTGESDGTYN